MDEKLKEKYEDRYQAEKQHGVKFYPDIVYKDLIVSFGLFLILLLLATFIGVKAEPPADPNDSSYVPRPEWYFLFLFQMLKYFPGRLEWVGTTVVPAIAILALLLLPFYDRSPFRSWRKRKFGITVMGIVVVGMIALTLLAVATTPPSEEFSAASAVTDQIFQGADLFGIQCVECHGVEGEGGEITAVEGLEGVVVDPMNVPEFIYTRTDDTIFNIIDYGQPDLGMPPFGLGYGGELTLGEIDAIVTFMRYTWDDRVEIPAEAAGGGVPELVEGQIPTYDEFIEPIVRRTCLSCHRPGRAEDSGNYLMDSYANILESGDYGPNFLAGDLGSNAIRMLHREEIEAGGAMPPSKALREDWIHIFEQWVLAGMPETLEDIPPELLEGAGEVPTEGTIEPSLEPSLESSIEPSLENTPEPGS